MAYRSKRNATLEPHKQVFADDFNPIEHRVQFTIAKFTVLTYLYNPVRSSISSYCSRRGRTTTSLPCVTMTQLTGMDSQTERTGTWPLSMTPASWDKRLYKVMMLPSCLSRTHCKPSINICLYVDHKLFHLLVSAPVSRVSDNIGVWRNVETLQVEV